MSKDPSAKPKPSETNQLLRMIAKRTDSTEQDEKLDEIAAAANRTADAAEKTAGYVKQFLNLAFVMILIAAALVFMAIMR